MPLFSTIPDLTKLNNYVYESNNEKNSFVDHLEGGVAFKQSNVWPLKVGETESIILKTHAFLVLPRTLLSSTSTLSRLQ